eukprot:evm.model.NODE_41842_length_10797_cov_36.687969.2
MGPTSTPTPTPPLSPDGFPSDPSKDEAEDGDHDSNNLTLPELKTLVRKKLRESGAIDDILSQLRGHLLQPLARANFYEGQQAHQCSGKSLENVVLNSLVVDFLRHQKFRQTLAVFLPESHMLVQQHLLSRHDLAETLMLARSGDEREQKSLLHALVLPFRRAEQAVVPPSSSSHTQTQTEAVSTTTTTPPLPHHQHQHEERLCRFQQECEARAQKEIAEEISHFRETELTHLRLEEAAKHRRELLIVREEMQATQDRKVKQAWAHAKEEERRVHIRLQAAEMAQFEARQAVLRDMEAIRRREEEVERAEARAAERQANLDKEQLTFREQVAAWARQRAGEVAAAHSEGAKAYASQLQSLQVQQHLVQEELRKVHAERLVCQEQGAEMRALRRRVEEARGCVEEVEMLKKEKERWVVARERLQRQEEEAWAREQEATAMVRNLERTCGSLENEKEKMRQNAGDDEVELEGLREEVRTLRDLLATSRKALDCLGGRAERRSSVQEAQQGQIAETSHVPLPLFSSKPDFSQPSLLSPVALPLRTSTPVTPMPPPTSLSLPMVRPPPSSPLRCQPISNLSSFPSSSLDPSSTSSSSSSSSTAIESAMRAYETEVQKLQEVHDEFLLLHGEGENGAANAAITATATAAGATKKQVGNDDEEEEGEVVEESKK